MKRIFNIVLLSALVGLGYWLWMVFFPNPQQIIRSRLNKVASLVSFTPGEGNIASVAKLQRLSLLFAENVQVNLDAPGMEAISFTSRDELMQATMAAKRLAKGLKAEFLDMNIDLDPTGQSAVVDLTLKAKVSGESDLILQELKFGFQKIKDDWLITKVETVKTLKQ